MQHRISLSKTLLIAVKNRRKETKPVIIESPRGTRFRTEDLPKKYVRYAALAGLTRIGVEEIY